MPSAIAATRSASSSPPASPDLSAAQADWREGGFGIYVHWPFCAAKCPYCDFNSHVRPAVDEARWRRALVHEIARSAAEVTGRRVDSVFFGGGTPSLMAPETVDAVLRAVERGWGLAPGTEITLEANPTSVEAKRFAGYAAAGVNRISLGVQALDDASLRRLGRLHDAAEALEALRLARLQFKRVSIDLIYARQGQSAEAWADELASALALGIDHLSLYQLTVEPGTRFHALRQRGALRGLPDDAGAAELYTITQTICATAGLPAYEISNHARPGAESRHNRIYWRYGDYVGIGPGAHGRLSLAAGRMAVETQRSPEAWLAAVETRGSGEVGREVLGHRDQAAEMLMMGLRLAEGVRLERFARLMGQGLDRRALAALEQLGLVRQVDGRLVATEGGSLLLEGVLRELLP